MTRPVHYDVEKEMETAISQASAMFDKALAGTKDPAVISSIKIQKRLNLAFMEVHRATMELVNEGFREEMIVDLKAFLLATQVGSDANQYGARFLEVFSDKLEIKLSDLHSGVSFTYIANPMEGGTA